MRKSRDNLAKVRGPYEPTEKSQRRPYEDPAKMARPPRLLRKSHENRRAADLTNILRKPNENPNEDHANILRKSAAPTNQQKPIEYLTTIRENRRAAAAPTNRGPHEHLAKILRTRPPCATARCQCNLHALIHYTNTLHQYTTIIHYTNTQR